MGTNRSSSMTLPKGDRATVRVMRGLIKPTRAEIITPQQITVSGAVTQGATSITVAALTSPVYAKNYLAFYDADDIYTLVKVTADAAVGATALTVEATVREITDASVASWPPEVLGLSDAQINRSLDIQESQNFNTGGVALKIAGAKSYEVSTPGTLVNGNAGYLTAFDAFSDSAEVWLCIVFDVTAEQDIGVLGPETFIGKASISEASTTSPADGFREGGLTFAISGSPEEILFAAAA